MELASVRWCIPLIKLILERNEKQAGNLPLRSENFKKILFLFSSIIKEFLLLELKSSKSPNFVEPFTWNINEYEW